MKFLATSIPDVIQIEPRVFGDARGFFFETWNARDFAESGIEAEFVQDSHSRSIRGVLRGLHYQIRQPQGKLIRVIAGEVFDVVVDIRRSSPTFGHHVAVRLSAVAYTMLQARALVLLEHPLDAGDRGPLSPREPRTRQGRGVQQRG